MSRISDILSKQVAVAETLLQRAIAIPDGDRNTRVAGYIRYDESITRPLAKDVEAWQTETTELLRVLYGEEARQVADFERCINNKNHYFKFREGIQSEIQDCISKLNAFPTFTLIFYLPENQRGFKKRGDSPTTFPQQFQLLGELRE